MGRRLLTVAVFLLAGAVVNVAVAWGCAVFVDFTVAPGTVGGAGGYGGQDWVIWLHDGGSAVRIRALAVSGNIEEHKEIYPTNPSLLPRWGPLAAQVDQPWNDGPFVRIADAYGWPRLSMWCSFAWDVEHWPKALMDPPLCAIPIMSRPGVSYDRSLKALPLRPAGPDFAFNTLFYAVLLWLLIPGPFALRRLIRRRRGLCPKCAYPMGESAVCTECGRELPKLVRPAT